MNVFIHSLKKRIANAILAQRVRRKDFTIISSDCWGSSLYQELGLTYNTPFVGLFFYAPCYLRLLQNLAELIPLELAFLTTSRYDEANLYRKSHNHFYPIGLLERDIEIHFLHYENQAEAREKWYRRKARMNMTRLFVGFSDRNLCTLEHLVAFDQLPYSNKVVFTARPYPELQSSIWLEGYKGKPYIGNIYSNRQEYKKYFDAADWLNAGSGKPSGFYRMINKLFDA